MEDERDVTLAEGVGDGSEGTEEAHEAGEAEARSETPPAKPAKTYTPEQLRRAISREVARERKKYEPLEHWRPVVGFFESAGPEAKAKLQELIHELAGSGAGPGVGAGRDRYEELERRLAYKDALDEIADSDDFFRKHRTEFYEWCDEEGYDEAREDPRILRLAYRAWRNDPAVRAALEAESKPAEQPKPKSAPGGKGIPSPRPPREKSELEILRELKIPLFTGEE